MRSSPRAVLYLQDRASSASLAIRLGRAGCSVQGPLISNQNDPGERALEKQEDRAVVDPG